MSDLQEGNIEYLIMCIGNRQGGDDAIGPYIADKLKLEKYNGVVLDCGTVPENFTSVVKKYNPNNLIIIDAVEMNLKVGEIRIVPKEKIGIMHISTHDIPISTQSPEQISKRIMKNLSGVLTVLAPIIRQKKGTYENLIKELNKEGYTRVRVNKEIHRTDEDIPLERYKKHDIEIVIDRVETTDRTRLVEACEQALQK